MSFLPVTATSSLDAAHNMLDEVDVATKILGLEEFSSPWSSSSHSSFFLPIEVPLGVRLNPLLFNFDFGKDEDSFFWYRLSRSNFIEGSTLDKTFMRFRKVTKSDLNKSYNVKKISFTPVEFIEFSKRIRRSVRKLLKASGIPLTDHNVGTFVILACSIIENEHGSQRIFGRESRILDYMSLGFSLSLIVSLCWNHSLSDGDHETIVKDFKDSPEEWISEVFGSNYLLNNKSVVF